MIHTENKALSYSKMNKLTGQIKPQLKVSHRLNANTFMFVLLLHFTEKKIFAYTFQRK